MPFGWQVQIIIMIIVSLLVFSPRFNKLVDRRGSEFWVVNFNFSCNFENVLIFSSVFFSSRRLDLTWPLSSFRWNLSRTKNHIMMRREVFSLNKSSLYTKKSFCILKPSLYDVIEHWRREWWWKKNLNGRD